MSTALDMAQLLQTAGIATQGTNLFVNEMPAKPGTALACFDLPGSAPVTAHGNVQVNQRRYVQIQSRNVDSQLAAAAAQAAIDALAGQINVTVNARTYEMIRALGSAALLGRDDNGLTTFYCEIEATLDLG